MVFKTYPQSPQMDNWFGVSLATMLLCVASIIWWRWGLTAIASTVAAIGILQGVLYYLAPRFRAIITRGFFIIVWPLSAIVSVILLALLFFLVVTPIGIILRLLGRDPLAKLPSKTADTYWVNCAANETKESYFRQY